MRTGSRFMRAGLLLKDDGLYRLSKAKVAVFGIGGVGGYVCEALARCGVGSFLLVDGDIVDITNVNRQIIATESTLGKYKAEVMKERISDINPEAEVRAVCKFFKPEPSTENNNRGFSSREAGFSEFSYVIDATDDIEAKLGIILAAKGENVPVISSMGAGNKLDPSRFRAADIYETSVCPLAKVMRKRCREAGIESLKVVFSDEEPRKTERGKPVGSVSFVPSACALVIAGEVVRELAFGRLPVA